MRYRKTILLLILAFGSTFGQDLKFEVASVKPSPPLGDGRVIFGTRGGPGTADPGQINAANVTLKNLLTIAYDVQPYQVTGPDWIDTERYDVVANVPPETTKEQARMMWRALLAERFGVALHHESKEFKVDELVVAKGGPKLKQSDLDPNAVPAPPAGPPATPPKIDKNGFPEISGPGLFVMVSPGSNGPIGHMVAKGQSLADLAKFLGNELRHAVIDKTGLTAKYDFTLEYTPDLMSRGALPPPPGLAGPAGAGPADSASEPGSNIATAVQQLGLKLESKKAPLDLIVIDSANKVPTEN